MINPVVKDRLVVVYFADSKRKEHGLFSRIGHIRRDFLPKDFGNVKLIDDVGHLTPYVVRDMPCVWKDNHINLIILARQTNSSVLGKRSEFRWLHEIAACEASCRWPRVGWSNV